MEVSGQLYALATLPVGKGTLVTTGQEAGWTPESVWIWWGREKVPAKNEMPVIQPMA